MKCLSSRYFCWLCCCPSPALLRRSQGSGRDQQAGIRIQVGAFSEVKNAERLTVKLQAKGVEAFYFKKDNGIYAVRFGDFPSHNAARNNARKLVADKVIDSYLHSSAAG